MSATQYQQNSAPQKEDGLKLIERVSPEKNSKVLDLGCGTGYLASVLSDLVGPLGKVVGVDPDAGRVKIASETYERSNLEFLESDGENFPGGDYDLVFANHVIHWIKDKDAVFRRVYQSLRPGGRFAFTVEETLAPTLLEINNLMGAERSKAILDNFSLVPPIRYEEWASTIGLALTLKVSEQQIYSYPNIDAIFDAWCAANHGRFDPTLIERDIMVNFKQPYGDGPVDYVMPLHSFIFTKP